LRRWPGCNRIGLIKFGEDIGVAGSGHGGTIVLAVDLGTTSAKALAFDAGSLTRGGRAVIAARAEREYPLLTPEPGAAEQDPELILEAAAGAVREAVNSAGCGPDGVAAVAFSTAMHSLIAVDADGRALTPALTWADLRAAGHARRLRACRPARARRCTR